MKYMTVFSIILVTICGCLPGDEILNQVSYEMEKKFSEQVSVSILNDEYLIISLINSKKNKLNDDEKEKYANEIALYIFENAVPKKQFIEISIKYKIQIDAFFVRNTRTTARFDFVVEDFARISKKPSE